MRARITELPLSGVLKIEPMVFVDPRGFFCELWNRRTFAELGIHTEFVQDNLSWSRQNCIRGMHFQNPAPQAKLVTVLEGEVFDVVVDLRRSSPTFGRWHGVVLSSENKAQLYIPAGFAHGFAVLSPFALFHYKCSNFYNPACELTLRWDDPELGIKWPVSEPILSEKDRAGLLLRQIPPDRLFP